MQRLRRLRIPTSPSLAQMPRSLLLKMASYLPPESFYLLIFNISKSLSFYQNFPATESKEIATESTKKPLNSDVAYLIRLNPSLAWIERLYQEGFSLSQICHPQVTRLHLENEILEARSKYESVSMSPSKLLRSPQDIVETMYGYFQKETASRYQLGQLGYATQAFFELPASTWKAHLSYYLTDVIFKAFYCYFKCFDEFSGLDKIFTPDFFEKIKKEANVSATEWQNVIKRLITHESASKYSNFFTHFLSPSTLAYLRNVSGFSATEWQLLLKRHQSHITTYHQKQASATAFSFLNQGCDTNEERQSLLESTSFLNPSQLLLEEIIEPQFSETLLGCHFTREKLWKKITLNTYDQRKIDIYHRENRHRYFDAETKEDGYTLRLFHRIFLRCRLDDNEDSFSVKSLETIQQIGHYPPEQWQTLLTEAAQVDQHNDRYTLLYLLVNQCLLSNKIFIQLIKKLYEFSGYTDDITRGQALIYLPNATLNQGKTPLFCSPFNFLHTLECLFEWGQFNHITWRAAINTPMLANREDHSDKGKTFLYKIAEQCQLIALLQSFVRGRYTPDSFFIDMTTPLTLSERTETPLQALLRCCKKMMNKKPLHEQKSCDEKSLYNNLIILLEETKKKAIKDLVRHYKVTLTEGDSNAQYEQLLNRCNALTRDGADAIQSWFYFGDIERDSISFEIVEALLKENPTPAPRLAQTSLYAAPGLTLLSTTPTLHESETHNASPRVSI